MKFIGRQIGWCRLLGFLSIVSIVLLMFHLICLGFFHLEPEMKYSKRLDDLMKDNIELMKIPEERPELSTHLEHALRIHSPNLNQPSRKYERTLMKIGNDVQEFWYYINSELTKFKKESPQLASKLEQVISETAEHKRSLIKDLGSLQASDLFEEWRSKESLDLSDLVQRRLEYLQNPADCRTARKLVCNLNKGCGYGCQLHHVVYCFIVAYATQRTLIMKSKGWRYARGGWEEVFEPVSKTCTSLEGASISNWPGHEDTQVINLPVIDSISPRPPYLPLSIPKDLEPRLSRLHGDPIVWWIGQILKYLFKPQPKTREFLNKYGEKINFQKPIVGIHIRRTDKVGTEAAFHHVDEYMAGVEDYYKQLALTQTVNEKRVYVATDDPQVLTEIQEKYPQYKVLGDPSIAQTASVGRRYSESSLMGIITDIHYLSNCNYLVCTFSSQICRVAYEYMNTMYPDASARYKSLDDIYYFGGQVSRIHIAVLPHTPKDPSEMELVVGDRISVAGNHWNGYSKGTNLRTNQLALYPTFKVVPHVETAEFPTYPQVPLSTSPSEQISS
uniref:Alpha-(1,6)-fucosyltransferase n=1 Tax=Cacopsylla melanoneura TaxID=428564 RepID=A0A8D8Y921_9HEMI